MSEIATRNEQSAEVAQRTQAQELIAQVRSDQFKEQIAMALPENMPPSRFVRATVTALMQNPALAECEPNSLFASLLKCAQDGLLPDGREAALVPYKGRVQYLPMIGGYRKIAAEHGWTIRTNVVYQADEFEFALGLEPKVDHRPAPIGAQRGQLVAAYAIGVHRDGRKEIEVLDAEEIARARKMAQTQLVWNAWEDRMWEKTAGKRLFAKLPLDPGDKRVARLLADAEEIGPAAAANMLYGPHGEVVLTREITQDSSDKGAVSQAQEEGPRSPTPADGGSDGQGPGLAAPSPGSNSGDRQAGAGDSGGDTSAAAPAPGAAEPTLEPVAKDEQSAFQIPEAAIDEASLAYPPTGQYSHLTLAGIQQQLEKSDEWFLWALQQEWSDDFAASLRLFVEHRAAGAWATYTGGGS